MSTISIIPTRSTIEFPGAGGSPVPREISGMRVPRRSRQGSVRLTRRGRFVVFLASLSMALVATFVLASGAVGTDEAGQQAPVEIVMVGPGDTLWGIASEHSDGGDVRDMMNEIERLNALDSAQLAIGQKLAIPAAPGGSAGD